MKSTLILDCSITMAWCFSDEKTPRSEQVLDRLLTETAVVPVHWILEVSNVLAMAERRNRIQAGDAALFVRLLGELDLEIDRDVSTNSIDHLLSLCRRHRLTSYDALDLELALRRNLPLASLDRDLCHAAAALGIDVITN